MLWGVTLEGDQTEYVRRVGGLCPVAVEEVLLGVVPALEVDLAVLCGEQEFEGDSEDAMFGFRPRALDVEVPVAVPAGSFQPLVARCALYVEGHHA